MMLIGLSVLQIIMARARCVRPYVASNSCRQWRLQGRLLELESRRISRTPHWYQLRLIRTLMFLWKRRWRRNLCLRRRMAYRLLHSWIESIFKIYNDVLTTLGGGFEYVDAYLEESPEGYWRPLPWVCKKSVATSKRSSIIQLKYAIFSGLQ